MQSGCVCELLNEVTDGEHACDVEKVSLWCCVEGAGYDSYHLVLYPL